MRLATFTVATPVGSVRRIGADVAGRIVDLAAAYAVHVDRADPGIDAEQLAGLLFPNDLVAFLGLGDLALEAARQAIEAARALTAHDPAAVNAHGARVAYDRADVRLLAPVHRPRVIRDFLSFEGHMKQASRALGRGGAVPPAWYQIPAYYKGDPDTVSGPEDDIAWPAYSDKLDFELELGMVVGRRGKNIPKEQAPRYVAGYTIFNDFSARDQQMAEGVLGMGPSKGKDFDGGNAIGPFLVTPDELDVRNLRMTARVNGDLWSDGNSGDMHWTFADLIAHVSQSETIYPGELYGSGTCPGGSGLELDRWLRPGDVVELEIEGIGVLRNRVVSPR